MKVTLLVTLFVLTAACSSYKDQCIKEYQTIVERPEQAYKKVAALKICKKAFFEITLNRYERIMGRSYSPTAKQQRNNEANKFAYKLCTSADRKHCHIVSKIACQSSRTELCNTFVSEEQIARIKKVKKDRDQKNKIAELYRKDMKAKIVRYYPDFYKLVKAKKLPEVSDEIIADIVEILKITPSKGYTPEQFWKCQKFLFETRQQKIRDAGASRSRHHEPDTLFSSLSCASLKIEKNTMLAHCTRQGGKVYQRGYGSSKRDFCKGKKVDPVPASKNYDKVAKILGQYDARSGALADIGTILTSRICGKKDHYTKLAKQTHRLENIRNWRDVHLYKACGFCNPCRFAFHEFIGSL